MAWFRRRSRRAGSGPQPGDPLRPAPPDYPAFISGAGASITSHQVLAGQGRIRYLTRDQPKQGVPDNGWRIFGEFDTDDYVADSDNLTITDFNRLCAIEPALIGIWDLPVGSDLEIVRDAGRISIVDVVTGQEIPHEAFYVPGSPRGE